METYVIRVWLPDRPGALGQVASRIGAARGDVIGIDILERGAGQAIDDLTVQLPDASWLSVLLAEVSQTEGVAVERVRRIEVEREEPSVHVLGVAARLAECVAHKRIDQFCAEAMDLVEGTWAAAVVFDGGAVAVRYGDAPSDEWLTAYAGGVRHLPSESANAADDIASVILSRHGMAVLIGRNESGLRSREREELIRLGRLVDCLASA